MTLKNMSLRLIPLANRPRRVDLAHLRVIDLADWTLRGISQVVFQNNRLTGLVILGAIAYNSGTYAVSCVLGTIAATLTATFVLVGWLFISAVLRFGQLHPGPLLAPALPMHFTGAQHYTWTTWYQGTGKGIGEIFLQDNWITGYAILFGIFI